jgi:hypothetical protein
MFAIAIIQLMYTPILIMNNKLADSGVRAPTERQKGSPRSATSISENLCCGKVKKYGRCASIQIVKLELWCTNSKNNDPVAPNSLISRQ